MTKLNSLISWMEHILRALIVLSSGAAVPHQGPVSLENYAVERVASGVL